MKRIFTKKFMTDNKGCYSQEELEACSFMKNKTITLESILNSEISTADKYWFVWYKLLSDIEKNKLDLLVRDILLEWYKDYPNTVKYIKSNGSWSVRFGNYGFLNCPGGVKIKLLELLKTFCL